MNEMATIDETQDSACYPIRTVADLTHVNPITLRAWERRYGLFEPVRKASGHRLYTQGHVDLITRVVGLLDRGLRIGQIKAQLDAEARAKRTERGEHQAGDDLWKRHIDGMIAAVIQFNEAALEEVYGNALSLYPMDVVTSRLLLPLLQELGRRWEQDEGSIAEEHFFAFYLRNKLGARFHHRPRTGNGAKLLMACLPGDRHETGLLLFALNASSAGYVTILLGADMPLEDLPAVVGKTGCQAIVLSGVLMPAPEVLSQDLPRLTRRTNVPVLLGGPASVKAHDVLRRTGVRALGADLNMGLERLLEIVPVNRR